MHTCRIPGCNKSFKRAHDLKRHYGTHQQYAGLYKCPFCQMEFSRADSVKRHLNKGCESAPQQGPGGGSGGRGDGGTGGRYAPVYDWS